MEIHKTPYTERPQFHSLLPRHTLHRILFVLDPDHSTDPVRSTEPHPWMWPVPEREQWEEQPSLGVQTLVLWEGLHPGTLEPHIPAGAGAPRHAARSPVPVSPDLGFGGLPHGAAQWSRSVLDLVAHWRTPAPALGVGSPLTGLPGPEHGRLPGNNFNFQSWWSQEKIPACHQGYFGRNTHKGNEMRRGNSSCKGTRRTSYLYKDKAGDTLGLF